MSEPDRLSSSDEGYVRPKVAPAGAGGIDSDAAGMSLVSQEAQRGELCEGGGEGGGWGVDAAFDGVAHGALAAQGGLGQAFLAEMSRRGQSDEVRAGWEGADGGGGGEMSAGMAGAGMEQADGDGGGFAAASGPRDARDGDGRLGSAGRGARVEDDATGDEPVIGPVGPDNAHPPPVDAPLIYRSDGRGVTVELLIGDAPPSGWTVVEPGERVWPLYYALFRARTDPGEVDFAALGPVVGEVFGPQLMAGLPGMGPWGKPDGLPGGLYVGTEAHRAIGEHYKARSGERPDVFVNDVSVSQIAAALKLLKPADYGHLRPELGGPFKPDITDAGLKLLYEIKPAWSAAVGQAEAQAYILALKRVGLDVGPGGPGVPGTKGKLAAPGGWFTFDVVMPGVIGYRYLRTQPVPHLLPLPERVPAKEGERSRKKRLFEWKYWEEVTGLSGVALLVYLILSQGSRIIPVRNAIPIP